MHNPVIILWKHLLIVHSSHSLYVIHSLTTTSLPFVLSPSLLPMQRGRKKKIMRRMQLISLMIPSLCDCSSQHNELSLDGLPISS